jgi:hypothetical protein
MLQTRNWYSNNNNNDPGIHAASPTPQIMSFFRGADETYTSSFRISFKTLESKKNEKAKEIHLPRTEPRVWM